MGVLSGPIRSPVRASGQGRRAPVSRDRSLVPLCLEESSNVSQSAALVRSEHAGIAEQGERAQRRRRPCVLEALENRTLLSGSPTIYTVDARSDTGTGSGDTGDLRYCITQANANTNPAGSLIQFDLTVFNPNFNGPDVIALSSTVELSETAGPEMIEGPVRTDPPPAPLPVRQFRSATITLSMSLRSTPA